MNDARFWRADFSSDPNRQWTYGDILPYFIDRPLHFEPGSQYDYSNSNYILAGMIIEQVTGRSMHDLIRKRILSPIGLQHTFNGHEDTGNEQSAHGYLRRRGRIIDTLPWYGHYGLANAGIYSTPGDIALFIRSLFTTDKLLSKAMRAEMTRIPESVYPASRYGIGIYVLRNHYGAGFRWYLHDGIDPGYQAGSGY